MPAARAPNSRPCQSRKGINAPVIRRLASARWPQPAKLWARGRLEASGHPGHGTPTDNGRTSSQRGRLWLTPLLSNERVVLKQISQYGGPLPVRHQHGRSALRPSRAGEDAGGDDRRSSRRQKRGPLYDIPGDPLSPRSAPSSAWSKPSAGSSDARVTVSNRNRPISDLLLAAYRCPDYSRSTTTSRLSQQLAFAPASPTMSVT